MITNLHLQNFRRHADTELSFAADSQIVLLAGRNGAGKTTVLEAVTYALYGVGRHGRRNLGKLVRRGAELEGMQVNMTFVVGDVTYEVIRRLERGKSSAQLFANGGLIHQSPDGVTAEIGRVLGMDVVGFKLAVIAQQKELDGLADLTSAKRKATMSRLLRLDVITKAARDARDIYNREKDIAAALGAGPDIDALNVDLTTEADALTAARAAYTEARDVVVGIDGELAASASLESAWQAAREDLVAATATAAAVQGECDRLDAELSAVSIPEEVPAPSVSLEDLGTALTALERDITRGEDAQRLLDSAAATRRELDTVTARLTAVDAELGSDTPEALTASLTAADAQLLTAQAALETLDEQRNGLLEQHSAARTKLSSLDERERRAAEVGDVCDACEQPVSEDHKHTQQQARAAERAQLTAEVERIQAAGNQLKADRQRAQEAVSSAAASKTALERRAAEVRTLLGEQADLRRRRATYTAQLERLDVEPVDLDELYARKADLKIAEAQASQAAEVARARALATERRDRLAGRLQEATRRLEAARAARSAAEPDADLTAAYAHRQDTITRRGEEAELASACESEVRAAEERVAAAQRRVDDAHGHADTARRHKAAAAVAAKTAELLTDVAHRLATEIRPALEGEVGKLLSLLSEGRFTSAKVSEDYDISVLDDGKYEPLTEFSGGEADLIALAVRLALANVVADRHGAGGAGFLILDEVFGSQDDGRRDAILTGLRNLKGIYGQIFLISHVGGLNEEADIVYEVGVGEEDRTADVVAA